MTEKLRPYRCLDGLTLKCVAMAAMLLDHAGMTLFPDVLWLRCVGRLAFPVFAFLAAEGFAYTRNFRKYLARMAVFAVFAEIPFNLACSGHILCWEKQNVMWTLCLALLLLRGIGWAREKLPDWEEVAIVAALVLGMLAGEILRVDYGGEGVAMVLLFWLCRREKGGALCQVIGMFVLCTWLGGGICYLAMLALFPIWLYNGLPGPRNKVIQYTCYVFYPVHLLLLGILTQYIS